MYVVLIKSSARRINRSAGEYLARRGSTRSFPEKAAAREWAMAISDGDGAVRVQDAAPNDPQDIDGYLVADPVERRTTRQQADGSMASLGQFHPVGDGSTDEGGGG